jgi:hypothetical protein
METDPGFLDVGRAGVIHATPVRWMLQGGGMRELPFIADGAQRR